MAAPFLVGWFLKELTVIGESFKHSGRPDSEVCTRSFSDAADELWVGGFLYQQEEWSPQPALQLRSSFAFHAFLISVGGRLTPSSSLSLAYVGHVLWDVYVNNEAKILFKAMSNWAINIIQRQSQWSHEFSQDRAIKSSNFYKGVKRNQTGSSNMGNSKPPNAWRPWRAPQLPIQPSTGHVDILAAYSAFLSGNIPKTLGIF